MHGSVVRRKRDFGGKYLLTKNLLSSSSRCPRRTFLPERPSPIMSSTNASTAQPAAAVKGSASPAAPSRRASLFNRSSISNSSLFGNTQQVILLDDDDDDKHIEDDKDSPTHSPQKRKAGHVDASDITTHHLFNALAKKPSKRKSVTEPDQQFWKPKVLPTRSLTSSSTQPDTPMFASTE